MNVKILFQPDNLAMYVTNALSMYGKFKLFVVIREINRIYWYFTLFNYYNNLNRQEDKVLNF